MPKQRRKKKRPKSTNSKKERDTTPDKLSKTTKKEPGGETSKYGNQYKTPERNSKYATFKSKPDPIQYMNLGKRPENLPAGVGWVEPAVADGIINDGRDRNMKFVTKSGTIKFNFERNH